MQNNHSNLSSEETAGKSDLAVISEQVVGYFILTLLVIIAIGVYWKHLRFNPGVTALEQVRQSHGEKVVEQAQMSDISFVPPESFSKFSAPETFDQATLSDKINGKAELYLPAGFRNLFAQRLVPRDGPDVWYEVFIYDMENILNAFSVYSAQRRTDATPEQFVQFGYRTENAIFYVHGPYYVEIIASEPSDKTRDHLLSLAKTFISRYPVKSETIEEISLFPKENLVEYSIRYIPANAFGFEGLDRIFAARYRFENNELTGFISRRNSTEEAFQRAEAFFEFMVTYGGTDISESIHGLDIKMVDFFGTFEAILIVGSYLTGVHEANSREDAIKLVKAIYEKLQQQ